MKTLRYKRIFLVSLAVALITAIIAATLWPAHVYRALSGYSGHHFWLAFHSYPTEKQLYEAVLAREPSLSLGNDRLDEVQAARRGFVRGFPAGDLALFPYDSTKSPDVVFADGGHIKGVWLTEPATRTEFPPSVVRITYFIGVAIVAFFFASLVLVLLSWLWYFTLARIAELSSAVRRPNQ